MRLVSMRDAVRRRCLSQIGTITIHGNLEAMRDPGALFSGNSHVQTLVPNGMEDRPGCITYWFFEPISPPLPLDGVRNALLEELFGSVRGNHQHRRIKGTCTTQHKMFNLSLHFQWCFTWQSPLTCVVVVGLLVGKSGVYPPVSSMEEATHNQEIRTGRINLTNQHAKSLFIHLRVRPSL